MKNKDKQNEKYSLKIILVGDPNVGKTNIAYRYCKGAFRNEYQVTIGVDYLSKNIIIDDILFRVQIWDTGGSEKFRSISRTYYRNTACALIVYDISDKKTFKHALSWIDDIKRESGANTHIILVGNKDDLKNRKVTEEEGKELAEKYDLKFFETSALNGHNIEEVFIDAYVTIADKIKNGKINIDDSYGIKRIYDENEFIADKRYNRSLQKLDKNNHINNGQNNEQNIRKKKCC